MTIDIAGHKFARLMAIRRVKGRFWLFRCDCGNDVERDSYMVKRAKTRSCGCLNKERLQERRDAPKANKHPLHALWAGMIQRCYYPKHSNFKNYGAKGIEVCERWRSFEYFVEDMSPRPSGTTLDRLNSKGNYEPGNCKWSTRTEQSENTSRNHYIELDGERLTISQWARKLGLSQPVIRSRLKRGWTDRDAIMKPIGEAEC